MTLHTTPEPGDHWVLDVDGTRRNYVVIQTLRGLGNTPKLMFFPVLNPLVPVLGIDAPCIEDGTLTYRLRGAVV